MSRRFNPSMIVRPMLWALLLVVLALGLAVDARAQVDGIACNPNIRDNNRSCTDGADCRRVRGDCGLFNFLCVDDPNATKSTAAGWGICNLFCSADSVGRCESGVVFCNADSDCVTRERCVNGACFFQEGSCVANTDCPSGQVCNSFSCVAPPAAACNVTTDCATGERCLGGRCEQRRAESCTSNSQCGSGEVCRRGGCFPRLPAPSCFSRTQCAEDETCLNNQCVGL